MSVLTTQLRGAARRPARLLLTGLAVMVAAFFAFGVVVAQRITERTVATGISGTPAATSLVVSTDQELMPASALAALRAVPGVAEVAARLDGHVARAAAPEDQLLALDSDPGTGPLARVRVVAGDYPDAPGEVAVTRRTAQRLSMPPGTRVAVLAAGDKAATTLTVTAVVEAPQDDGFNLFAPDSVTTKILGSGYHRFDVRAAPGTAPGSLAAAVSRAVRPLAPQARVAYADEVRETEAREAVEQLEPIFVLLGMFVVIAMIAATLVAASTFRIVFTQRLRQLALLRAVGAGRGRLFRELAAEGTLTGLVAGVAGVAAAGGLAQVVPFALDLFGVRVAYAGFPLGPAVGVVVGAVVVTLLAVVAPALSAVKVSPLEALRTSATVDGRRGAGIVRLVFGALLALAAAGTAALVLVQVPAGPAGDDYDIELQLMLTVLSGTLAFGALLALGPALLPPLLRLVSWPIRRGGPVGQLAAGGIGGSPRRVAAVSAVVALGVTLIGGTLVASASLRSLAEAEIASAFPADIEVAAPGDRTLPAGYADRLRARAEIARVAPYRSRQLTAQAHGKSVEFRAADLQPGSLPTTRRLAVADGTLDQAGPGRVTVGRAVADVIGVRAGDTVTLVLGKHRVDVRVAAILNGSAPLGSLLADPADFDRLGVPPAPSGVLVDAAGSGAAAINAAQGAARAELGTATGTQVDVLADARDEVRGWLSALTAAAIGLLGLTVLIGAVGVGTTTALSVVERVRETGLLRAIGLSRGALRTMLTTEAGLYGMLGSVLGLALGVPYAWLAVLALAIDAPLEFPVVGLVGTAVAVAGLTAAAGLLPARRASRVSPVAALAAE